MDAVEDIKQRLSIEDVVGQYVQLKRAGRNWKGLSPWTNERSPSFVVSPEKQIWHDFSSSRGGDMFSFVMEMEGVDFKGALELLARQAGIDLDQYRTKKGTNASSRGQEKERLYTLLELATTFYQVQFSRHRPALEYVLKKRQFSKQTALAWRIGYSPEDGTALVTYARKKGFSEKELQLAGLASKRYRGLGDMFRGRIMIPLADQQGRIIGFTARLLADDPGAPKYINTPSTPLYDKSRHIFGLHLAKEAIRKNKFAVMAEGNLDVIASHQASVAHVVATAGTALTEYQLKTLGRFSPDIRLCFDADRAGVSATERAIPLASKTGVNLSVITIPSGKDPDELIRQDVAAWHDIIAKPVYALDWLIERYAHELDLSSAQGKRQFSDIVLGVVRGLNDPVEQEHYIGVIAKRIEVQPQTLNKKLQTEPKAPAPRLKNVQPRQAPDKTAAETSRLQNHLLALLLVHPAFRAGVRVLKPQMLQDQPPAAMLELLLGSQFTPVSESPEAPPQWQPLEDYGKMLLLLYEEIYQGIEESELAYEITRLQSSLIDRYVKRQKQRIARELATASDERANDLLEAVKKLDALLKRHAS